MSNIVIFGATSAIAGACARLWAVQGARFHLVARQAERLEQMRADLLARGAADVEVTVADLADCAGHAALVGTIVRHLTHIDIALIAHGVLPDQAACEASAEETLRQLDINALSVISLLTLLANVMATRGSGTLAVISSVAGDRGRGSNYVYGAAKAAVTAFCDGLRARLFKRGVHVLTVKPGFVDTPMTAGLPLPAPLVASPEKVASDIVAATATRRNTLYTPWFWRGVMAVIRLVPEGLFKRMKL
ncbi:MAG: SDR family oxidoreductase [Gammaproteobacteria bacterium]|nr:SDR family oxidoreductase [Gammaproteobacteria bacterium]